MPRRNTMERRADLLSARLEQRMGALRRTVTEPNPPFQVRVSELDQLSVYLERQNKGELAGMRARNGGPFSDDQVDQYIASMERAKAKHAPEVFIRQFQEPPELSSTPGNLHPGLLAALGLDGGPPPSPDTLLAAHGAAHGELAEPAEPQAQDDRPPEPFDSAQGERGRTPEG
jgi:hypothetical protein